MKSIKFEDKILDGKKISEEIILKISSDIKNLCDYYNVGRPKLGIIVVGNNKSAFSYIKNKIVLCEKAGILTELFNLSEDITQIELELKIEELNLNPTINGIIIDFPLPKHIDKQSVILKVSPDKDVDGIHPINFGKTALGINGSIKPATPYGILKIIKYYNIETQGKHIVIVGRSNIVGKPLSIMLGNDFRVGRATVTSCDINTPKDLLDRELLSADIVIIAVGIPKFLKRNQIKKGCVVIDVGVNNLDGKIVGDVDFKNILDKCSKITPVPGGVGPMTTSSLITNCKTIWEKQLSNTIKI